ncbi:MAG: cyclic nucleotide-binding domain-containing protein, partial [Pseudomonadota bacterium]
VAAYKDLAAPWKELLNYYQRMADSNIKYDQLYEQFVPPDLLDKRLQYCPGTDPMELTGSLELKNVSLNNPDGQAVFSNLSLNIPPGSTIAITGHDSSAQEKFVELLTRIRQPSHGRILFGDQDIATIPESILGPNFGYVGADSYIFNTTIFDNVFFGAKTVPQETTAKTPSIDLPVQVGRGGDRAHKFWLKEAEASGNSVDPFDTDWVNYQSINAADEQEALNWWLDVMAVVGVKDTLFNFALDLTIDPNEYPGFTSQILGARQHVRQQLRSRGLTDLVRHFDYTEYNSYASVAENILFGTPTDDRLAIHHLATNDYTYSVFKRFELDDVILDIGLRMAEILIEMFDELPAGHDFYEQFSFVDEDTLEELAKILRQVQNKGRSDLNRQARNLLASLTFELRVERHRLGLIDEALQAKLVEVRHYFHDNLPTDLKDAVALFDNHDYNPNLSIKGNLLFGRVAFSTAGAKEKVAALIDEVLSDLGIKDHVILMIRDLETGIGGARMPTISRQRIAMVRALIKRPKILVARSPMQSVSQAARDEVRQKIRKILPELTIIWVDQEIDDASDVDRLFVLQDGRLIEQEQAGKAAPADRDAAYGNSTNAVDLAEADGQRAETRLLAQVPIFRHLQPQQLKLLAFTAERLQFPKDTAFYEPGDQPDGVYVIVDGMVDMIRGVKGKEMVVGTIGPEGIVGELEVLSGIPRVALMRAVSDVVALRIDPTVLINFVRKDPELAIAVIRGIGLRSIGRADEWRQERDSADQPADKS